MMKWPLTELAGCCERALADEKSGSKERSILSLVTKNVKKTIKEVKNTQDTLPDADVHANKADTTPPRLAPSSSPPLNTAGAAAAERTPTSTGDPSRPLPDVSVTYDVQTATHSSPSAQPATGSRAPSLSTAGPTTLGADQFVTSADELNCLAYAAAIAVVGENGSHYGAIGRGSSKALASSLELVAFVLNGPLLPTGFAQPLPSFEFSKKDSHSGAQVFFSKLLGGGSQGAAKLSTPVPGKCISDSPPQQVRLLLVDAVLAASDVIRSRDTTDKLWFVYLSALSAAVVPQVSRANLGDTASEHMRADYLCLHDERLVKVLEFLFTALSLPEATPILIEATRNVMQRISRALSSYVEQHDPLSPNFDLASDLPPLTSGPLTAVKPTEVTAESGTKRVAAAASHHRSTPSGIPFPAGKGIEDMQRVLRLCSSIVTNAPVTSISGGQGTGGVGASGAVMTTSTPNGDVGDAGAVVSGQASQSYVAVTTALGMLLSFVVNGGPTFRKSDAIGQVVRQSVLPATMRSSLSPDNDLFRLSLNVILYSCFRFSASLVSETGTVFRHVYFRVLSSKFASLTQKLLVLDVFQKYIEEPQNLIGLFLNYDCNTYSQSVYEEMIHYLAALAFPWSTRHALDNTNPVIKELYSSLSVKLEYDVDDSLRQRAMEQLVMVADSNIQWIERFEDDTAVAGAAANNSGNDNASTSEQQANGTSSDTAQLGSTYHASVMLEEPREAVAGAGAGAVASSQDTFLQARRYKDAFKKCLYLFNDKATPEVAIDFLRNSVLFEGLSATPALDEAETSVATDAEKSTSKPSNDAVPTTSEDPNSRVPVVPSPPPPAQPADAGSLPSDVGRAIPDAKADGAPTAPTAAAAPYAADTPTADVTAASATAAGGKQTGEAREATPTIDDDSFDEAVEDAVVVDAHKVAVFLRRNEDYLDKLVLGDYFAKSFRKKTTRLVFEEWIKLHNFAGMTLDEALRLFLGGFKLLGEAQVVDKTMELFAAQYCRQNPTVFRAADTAFILSFSICMLNTDAHSIHIKTKMSLEGFIKNNAGIDDGMDVDPQILTGIYQRITRDEIVLRPSPHCPSFNAKTHAASGGGNTGPGSKKMATGVLRSVPILRNLIPLATAITDKVALPIDMFNSAERKREELYQAELTAALKDIMTVVQSSDTNLPGGANQVHLVMASRIEHAIPMWEVTVTPVCNLLIASLVRFFEDAETYTPISSGTLAAGGGGGGSRSSSAVPQPIVGASASLGVPPLAFSPTSTGASSTGAGGGGGGGGAGAEALNPCSRATWFLKEKPSLKQFMDALLHGLDSVTKVCCAFGNVMHTEMVVEHCFELTQLSQTVVCSGQPSPHVTVTQMLSSPRLALVSALLNLFLAHGTSLTAASWQFCYSLLSLLDASANGIDGVFRRKSKKLLQSASSTSGATAPSSAAKAKPSPPDVWFGDLQEVPGSVDRVSAANRQSLLSGLRQAPGSAVDLWLDRLFDATRYPFATQVHMANGLAPVAAKELQTERVFSLTKLFDFVSSCASRSSRLQWRELWSHARAVLVMAGSMKDPIAISTLDGLRIIALTYLMREELFNYSFQKEVLKPFEDILMSNQSVPVRMHVINIVSELVEFRASSLASGWSVVFSCLSHAAVIPEIVASAWEACEKIITTQLVQVKDYFSEFVFCLTTFACTNMEESIALKGISYLVACGHWLMFGLETPTADVRAPTEVVLWACRYGSAEAEAQAAHSGGRHLTRVTIAAEPISPDAPLKKPTSYALKTAYQVWMSLFEGLVPVVVIQSSVRVRAHAIDCIWALVRMYGSAFDATVQYSLFSGMLRPMLTTLVNHLPPEPDKFASGTSRTGTEPMSTASSRDSLAASSSAFHTRGMDRMDYNILVSVAFHGMLKACLQDPHLVELACSTLVHFCSTMSLTKRMMMNDLVSVLLGISVDFLSSGCLPETQDFFWSAALREDEAGDAPLLVVGGAVRGGSELPNSSSPAGVAGAAWMATCSPFVAGTMHEVLQLGRVDVVHLKRTVGWTELHHSPVARTRVDHLTGLCHALPLSEQEPLRASLRHAAMQSVSGLYRQLMARTESDRNERDTCLDASRDARRCLLVASFFTVVTGDEECLQFVLQPILSDSAPVDGTHRAADDNVDATGPERSGSSSGTTPLVPPRDAASVPAIERLLLVPYSVVMLEYMAECQSAQELVATFCHPVVGSTPSEITEVSRWIDAVSTHLVQDIKESREYCLNAQRELQRHIAEEAAKPGCGTVNGKTFKAYKGKGFMDTFRAARAPLSERVRHFSYETASPELLRRIFYEWRYLLTVVALRFTLERHLQLLESPETHRRTDRPTTALDVAAAVGLLPCLPSELEEWAADPFMRSCWDELSVRTATSTSSTVSMVVRIVDHCLRGAPIQHQQDLSYTSSARPQEAAAPLTATVMAIPDSPKPTTLPDPSNHDEPPFSAGVVTTFIPTSTPYDSSALLATSTPPNEAETEDESPPTPPSEGETGAGPSTTQHADPTDPDSTHTTQLSSYYYE